MAKKEDNEIHTADIRIKMLKLIRKRKNTPKEISDIMGISLAKTKKHLKKLQRIKLVKRDKSVKREQYDITLKGLTVLDPEEKRIWILASVLVISIAAITAAWVHRKFSHLYNPERVAPSVVETSGAPIGIYLFVLWIAVLLGLILYAAHKRRSYLAYEEARDEK